MPAELNDFLSAGEPPVYFTLGSYASFEVEKSVRMFLEAAKKAGIRAIIQFDWNTLSLAVDIPNVYKVQSIPHEHVFPHCAMIVRRDHTLVFEGGKTVAGDRTWS